MNFIIIFLTAVGLSMDAFAVAVAAGASIRKDLMLQALRIGGSFGFFQMIMPVIGWQLGIRFKHLIAAVDHWIAFALLVLIGLKMIREALAQDSCARETGPLTGRRLLLLSVATSIDALAVGLSFAFLDYSIVTAAVTIGVVTLIIATAGVLIGCFCCCLWGRRAELAGGVILILIGLNILIEHLAY